MTFKRKIEIFFKNIKIGITNLIEWLPIIWKNRGWDYLYTEQLLLKQLKYQWKTFKSKDNYVDWESENSFMCLKALRIAILLLERRECNKNYLTDDEDWIRFCNIFKKYHQTWWN